jgi:hypothetical protein
MRAEICEKKKVAPEAVGEVADNGEGDLVGAGPGALKAGLTMSYTGDAQRPLLLEKPEPGPVLQGFLGPNPNGPPEFIALAERLAPPAPAVESAASGSEIPMPKPRPAKLKK